MFLPSNITLQFGDSGDFVNELQRRLCLVKCYSDDMINGFYDGNTVNGVTRFQAMVGLHADGVAGPETLRRLNGVIAGDGTGKKEEEKKDPIATTRAMEVLYGNMPPQPDDPSILGKSAEQAAVQPPDQPGVMQPITNQFQSPESSKPPEPDKIANPPLQDSSLAAMLLSQPQQPRGEQQMQQRGDRPPVQLDPAAVAATANVGPDKNAPPLQAQPAEPKGIFGKVMQFANATLQRLSDYFEAKLPPSVMGEVREIGTVMARSGLREAPIPAGPEMARLPQTPARGPEQIQRV